MVHQIVIIFVYPFTKFSSTELSHLSVTSYCLVQVDTKIKLNWELTYIEPPGGLYIYTRNMGHINRSLII